MGQFSRICNGQSLFATKFTNHNLLIFLVQEKRKETGELVSGRGEGIIQSLLERRHPFAANGLFVLQKVELPVAWGELSIIPCLGLFSLLLGWFIT